MRLVSLLLTNLAVMVALDTVSKPTYLLVGEANPSGLVFLWLESKIWAFYGVVE